MTATSENSFEMDSGISQITIAKNRKISLDVLVALFGVGAWLGVNGAYVQLPLLVDRQPEGWTLPSYMVIVIQIANIGPLAYAALRRVWPRLSERLCIYVALFIGALALLLNAFFHPVTADVGGEQRSVLFLIFVFFSALVGCTSSVLFYPFMRLYRDIYLIPFLVGEGLSGLIPSLIALIQGVGGSSECVLVNDSWQVHYPQPKFNTTVFLFIISIVAFLSFIAFFLVNNLKSFKSEKVFDAPKNKSYEEKSSVRGFKGVILLLLMAIVNAFSNGIFPSIKSYSCLPYGLPAYHLAMTLGAISNPAACLLAVWVPKTSGKALAILSSLSALFASYVLATSLLSPYPPLQGTTVGSVLVVIAWMCAEGLVSYVKLSVYTVFRNGGQRVMMKCGFSAQAGSAIGSILLFLLVNYTRLFVEASPCQ